MSRFNKPPTESEIAADYEASIGLSAAAVPTAKERSRENFIRPDVAIGL